MRKRLAVTVIVAIVAIALGAFVVYGRGIWYPYVLKLRGPRTVDDVLRDYGPAARKRMGPHFQRARVTYPPRELALLVFKKEKRVALWARNAAEWRFVSNYPVLAASGHAGPKLREGDRQVPEGLYRIVWLNPNSAYHLSMKVDYPNAFDREMAKRDGRTNLGGDIFVHGNRVSIGCVAVGDPAIEELFTLAADSGHSRIRVVIAPNDLRIAGAVMSDETPPWTRTLYERIAAALRAFPVALESNASIDVNGMQKVVPVLKTPADALPLR